MTTTAPPAEVEAVPEAIAATEPPPAPAFEVSRRTLEEWRKARRRTPTAWLHEAACIAAGWTVEQRHHAETLTYTEAEYDAGLKLAGSTRLK